MERGVPGSKISIVFNTPDSRIFNRSKTVEVKPNVKKEFRIIYHGTVTKRLNVDLAIRAVAGLIPRIPCLDFTILGRGQDVEELMDLSKELGIREYVHFEGAVAGEKVAEILTRMDLGIVPNNKNISTELMLPVKMLECIALGIPVVVPRLNVIEYYFSDSMVIYFEPGNVNSLVSSILYAFNNESERIRKAKNAETFLAKYGWDTHKFVLLNLYQSLL